MRFVFPSFAHGFPLVIAVGLVACGDEKRGPINLGDADLLDDGGGLENDRAPADSSLIKAWLQSAVYTEWKCQLEPHSAVGVSPHGRNRICQNELVTDALEGAASGPFPAGATLVKEIYEGDTLSGLAVEVRANDGPGEDAWFFYELLGSSEIANGIGESPCVGCHDGAPRDFVWSTVD
jgi:hypothetical protein